MTRIVRNFVVFQINGRFQGNPTYTKTTGFDKKKKQVDYFPSKLPLLSVINGKDHFRIGKFSFFLTTRSLIIGKKNFTVANGAQVRCVQSFHFFHYYSCVFLLRGDSNVNGMNHAVALRAE